MFEAAVVSLVSRLVLGGALLLAAGCSGGETRLNLILISLDTCRADRLSLYDARRKTTPHLDRFAKEAVVFDDCLAQSALTAPSHLSILTSHYVHRHGLLNNQGSAIPPYTLASELRHLGWRTAAFTGHGSFRSAQGLDFGFDAFESTTGDPADTITRDLDEVLPGAYGWLDEIGAAPFFLMLHSYDPHCPFVPPEPWRERYGGWYEGDIELEGVCHPKAFIELMKDGSLGVDELNYINDLYDGEIAGADAILGTLFDELRRRELLDSSIVVFTSDHGEVLGNHGWIGHGQVWEEALRVPLLIRFPGGEWAGRHGDPVQLIDLAPTLLSALGAPRPDGMQGIDLMSLVRGEGEPMRTDRMRLARVGASPNRIAVRFGPRWKLIFEETEKGLEVLSLHDLKADPREAKNLAAGEGERVERMLERYAKWRQGTAHEDDRYQSEIGSSIQSNEDLELLEALGYVDGDGG